MTATPLASFWSELPLGKGVTLLHHDAAGIAALAKPAGVLSHPNMQSEQPRALLDAPYQIEGEYYEWLPAGATVPRRLHLLNRLDSATSGALLVCADAALADHVRQLFVHKHVHKIYAALVFGLPSQAVQIWRDQMAIKKAAARIRAAVGRPRARPTGPATVAVVAEAQMTVIRQRRQPAPPLALLKLDPRTGRSHQLRVQCAQHHLPIVGDATYGDFAANRAFARATGEKRLFLHSLETSFTYEHGGQRHDFKAHAPLPKEFLEQLQG